VGGDDPGELLLRAEFGRQPLWPERPFTLAVALAASFALVLAALAQLAPGREVADLVRLSALLMLPVAALWAIPRRWPPPAIECRADALYAPRFLISRRCLRVPYERIFDVAVAEGGRGVMLGVRGRLPFRYPAARLVRGESVAEIAACVRERMGALPDGAERLHALAERARLSLNANARPWATWGFVALIFTAFVAQSMAGVTVWDPVRLARFGANAPLLVERGELYRIVTANLLHAGIGHMYMNGMMFMVLGPRLEAVLGPARTAFVLLFSALGGAALASLSQYTLLSLGASTAVFGVVAALAYVNLARREQLPADLRVPLWLGLALAAAQVASEIRVDNLDHLAHIGGLAAGWVAAAVAIGRDDLVELREEPRWATRIALSATAVIWAGGLAWGGWRIADPDPASRAIVVDQVLQRGAPLPLLTRLALEVASDPDAPSDRLDLARAALERAVREQPASAALWEALASLHARDGALPEAIVAQWTAAVLQPRAARLLKLALLERDRLRDGGVLNLGPGSRLAPRFRFDPQGAPGAATIDLEFATAPTRGAVVHALVYRGEFLVGHMEVWVGASRLRGLRFESEDMLAQSGDLEFQVALVDTRPRNLPPGSVQVRFWGLARPGA